MSGNCLLKGPVTKRLITSLLEKVGEKTDSGGLSIFLGQVRADEVNGKKVNAIEYSAYEGMVNSEVTKIKKSISDEFEDVKLIEIVHSTGVVKAGEISLLVLVSAGHREQAISGCSKAVELIKANLPVWKKEIYNDDSQKWK
jgi:molybdopterin synthase catalytic subunit